MEDLDLSEISFEEGTNAPFSPSSFIRTNEDKSYRRFQAGYLFQRYVAWKVMKSWKKRYFRLTDHALLGFKAEDIVSAKYIYSFTEKSVATSIPSPENAFQLQHIRMTIVGNAAGTPILTSLIFKTTSVQERDVWVNSINSKIKKMDNFKARQQFQMVVADENVLSEQHQKDQEFFTQYQVISQAGAGSFSTVRKVFRRTTGEIFAVKCGKPTTGLGREVEILKKLDHPTIVKLHDCFICPDMIYAVMDYVAGDLCDQIVDRGVEHFAEHEAKGIIYKVASAIQYIHSKNIVHRDIKTENILLDQKGNVKLIDFGLSVQLEHQSDLITHGCGTPEYVAPEVVEKQPYGFKCDVFSLGVVTYIMLFGTFPFSIESAAELKAMKLFDQGRDIRNMSCLDPSSEQWSSVTTEAQDFVLSLLQHNPEERLSISQVLEHKWLTSIELNHQQLVLEEKERKAKGLFAGFELLMTQGLDVIKHGRKGTSHKTRLEIKDGKVWWQSQLHQLRREELGKKSIALKDISQVATGRNNVSFSLKTPDRTLDIETRSPEECETLIRGFQAISTQK